MWRPGPDGHPQRLAELLLRQPGWCDAALSARAARLLPLLRASRIGGSWWGMPPGVDLAGRIVVMGAPDHHLTRRMLAEAVAAVGAGRVALVSRRAGALGRRCGRLGIPVVPGSVDPWPVLEQAACVFAGGRSDIALLAGLLGTPVRCFTPGPLSLSRDPVRLAAAVLLLGSRYRDPSTGREIGCEEFLRLAASWRVPGPAVACCVGISFWKRRRIAEMVAPGRRVSFRKTAEAAVAAARRRGGAIAVWPSRAPSGLDAGTAAAGVPVARVEDGFVRSVGLGADFLPPLSVVLDREGLYYDATGTSDLEVILLTASFPPELRARAAALRDRMVAGGVTKYNIPGSVTIDPPPGRRVVLVPGQVADDRSVLLGGAGVRPGLDLLRRVRARMPDAWIVYKPHPDVDAGHRVGAVPDGDALTVADQVLRGGSMAALLEGVDEVHTLTSLTGFEALLRGRPVTTYGHPFYAGWGLTADTSPPPRRGRRLELDELVAGTLILYPRYVDPVTSLPCGPEIVLDRLADPALQHVSMLVKARRWQGRASVFLRRWSHRWPWPGRLSWCPFRVRNPVR